MQERMEQAKSARLKTWEVQKSAKRTGQNNDDTPDQKRSKIADNLDVFLESFSGEKPKTTPKPKESAAPKAAAGAAAASSSAPAEASTAAASTAAKPVTGPAEDLTHLLAKWA